MEKEKNLHVVSNEKEETKVKTSNIDNMHDANVEEMPSLEESLSGMMGMFGDLFNPDNLKGLMESFDLSNMIPKLAIKTYAIDNKYLPIYKTNGSVGFDFKAYLEGQEEITINPGEIKLINTGLKVELPENIELQVRPRSGLALKHGITVLNTPGTIDSDYRGWIGVILINHGKKPFVVKDGDRIAQGVLSPIIVGNFKIVEKEEDLNKTERGEGGFGSTGKE